MDKKPSEMTKRTAATKTPPPELSPGAAEVWKKYRARFDIDQTDEPSFEIFCESFAAWRNLLTEAEKSGPVVRVNGQPVPNPHLQRADREAEKCRKLISGLTAAATAKKIMDGEP